MKILSAFAKSFEDTKRIERKFIMGQGAGILAQSTLLANGFSEIYQNRVVRSIYFDDIDFNCLRDNVDGNPYRDKLRVRYYDGDVMNAKIEIKHKRNFLGFKSTFPLIGAKSETDLIKIVSSWISNNVSTPLFPVSVVEYQRTYFLKHSIRATVDTDVQASRICNVDWVQSAFRRYEVVELKYDESNDSDVRII
jgi:hypothetical protein